MNRIREGYVLVRNPYYKSQVTKYSLSQDIVDCLAFCTKNSEPMLEYLDELDKYKQYWFVTITPYGKDIVAYNTCGHLCKYCYANANKGLVIKHNEKSPFLIGGNENGDKITEARQRSWIVNKNEQISFI